METCHAGHTRCRFTNGPHWENLDAPLRGSPPQQKAAAAIREQWAAAQNWTPLDDAQTCYLFALLLAVRAKPFDEAAAWLVAARAGDLDRQLRQKADAIYESHRRATQEGHLDPIYGMPVDQDGFLL
ncbi:MAG: hypothetical protein ACREM3_31130 [Candidatus Rokuibacteriota bacterium]